MTTDDNNQGGINISSPDKAGKNGRMWSFVAVVATVLVAAQVLLVIVSWMISTAMPALHVRSLLSSEGIRWFFGHFVDNIASPLMLWIILLCIAFGAFNASGLQAVIGAAGKRKRLTSRRKYALWMALIVCLCYVAFIVVLTCAPHAILLSSMGSLFPSSFSVSIVPVIAFGILLPSVVYGCISGVLPSLTDLFHAVADGLPCLCPLLFTYILAAQLFFSLSFVFF